ncbi:MAG: sugar O-acetyltransferase [Lachnospiraceae bacterium]|nr:sugar O-acetyltransferase [Lachnospiraceae bacterium]
MTEKEKAAAGLLYDGTFDEDLKAERMACKNMCYEYNMMHPSKEEERKALLKKILGKTGEDLWIEQTFWCDYGYNIEVGENFYANHNLVILDTAKVTFGDNCFVAPNCGFYAAGHALDVEQRNKGLEIAWPITIGNNVWIGGSVSVMPGVTIGDDTVIAGGSVVVKDIPSGVLAGGNPCKVIRKITEEDRNKYRREKM